MKGIISKLIGLITFPLRFILWLVVAIIRWTPMGREKDPWVMFAFSVFVGAGSAFIYKWMYACMVFFLGNLLFTDRPGVVATFTVIWFIPTVLVSLRLVILVEPEWFNDYWNCPPPTLTNSEKTSNKKKPVFRFGDMAIRENAMFLGVICTGGIGSGKCWLKGTQMLMFDGSTRAVEEIQVGDQLMGPDSQPRTVQALGRGRSSAYWIQELGRPAGEGWGCNNEHILTLEHQQEYAVRDVPIEAYLNTTPKPRSEWLMFRTPVHFKETAKARMFSEVDFYFIGQWLMQRDAQEAPAKLQTATMDFGQEKKTTIPLWARTASVAKRTTLLGGMIVGSQLRSKPGSYKIKFKTKELCRNVLFLARSIGWEAYQEENNEVSLQVHPGARHQRYRWDAQPIGDADYYGFTLDKDGRCLLADFTVTHNTASFIYPLLNQLLRRYNTREGRPNCGGLMLDVKGEFIDSAITMMKQTGRDPAEDIVLINPDDTYTNRYNPVVPHMHHLQVANRFRAILNNLGGGGGDSFWLDSAEKVIAQSILLSRVVKDLKTEGKELTTLGDVNNIVADIKACEATTKAALAYGSKRSPKPGATEEEIIEFKDWSRNIAEVGKYFENQWLKMAETTRSGIQAAVTNQLLRGFTDPKLQRVFCRDTDFSFFDTCNHGKIVVLQAPGWGLTALMIGAALKLDFQQCMKDRLFRAGTNRERRVFFIADEYQEYVTCGGKLEGDETFYAVSRQSRIINAVATQSYNSIYSKCGSNGKEAVKVLLQNLRVKICLNGEDNETAKHVAELCGKVEKQRFSSWSRKSSFFGGKGEGGRNKSFNIEEKPMFEEWDFYQLKTVIKGSAARSYSEGIIFNGGATAGETIAKKVRMRPVWLNDEEKSEAKQSWVQARIQKRKAAEEAALEARRKKPLKAVKAAGPVTRTIGDRPQPSGFGGGLGGRPQVPQEEDPEWTGPRKNGGSAPPPEDDEPPRARPPVAPPEEEPPAPTPPPDEPPRIPEDELDDPLPGVDGIDAKGSAAPPSDTEPAQASGEERLKELLKKNKINDEYEEDDSLEPATYNINTAAGVEVRDEPEDRDDDDPLSDADLNDAWEFAESLEAEDAVLKARRSEKEKELIRSVQFRHLVQQDLPEETEALLDQEPPSPTPRERELLDQRIHQAHIKAELPPPDLEEQSDTAADFISNVLHTPHAKKQRRGTVG